VKAAAHEGCADGRLHTHTPATQVPVVMTTLSKPHVKPTPLLPINSPSPAELLWTDSVLNPPLKNHTRPRFTYCK